MRHLLLHLFLIKQLLPLLFSVHFCGFPCWLGMKKDRRLQNDIRRMIWRVKMVPFWFWCTFRIAGSRNGSLVSACDTLKFFAQWADLQKFMQNVWHSEYSRNQWTLFIQRFTFVVVPVWYHEEAAWLSSQLVGLGIRRFQFWPQVGCVFRSSWV